MEERRKKSEQPENERHFMEQKLEIEKLSRPDINHEANLQASICLYCGHTKNVQNDKHSSYSEKSTTYSVEGQRQRKRYFKLLKDTIFSLQRQLSNRTLTRTASGSKTLPECTEMQQQLTSMRNQVGMKLHKWRESSLIVLYF
ncbi:hypothetical protein NPIL_119891 [Nephila pilipes]|uniref:Uncharacterized protein n=1 Tax=Nephila pilipes TaxID=299642 RepID=A0A8X6R4X9_NEPPI|nr:hypothetical protein NPIL_42781 [Nephila pilipes]GFT18140.1 hypothetical protein NPIL_189231 [Nephila pilipes]GFT72115.1 hypothetical protein NPIL_416191 [Nephila pilipes]GFU60234.1 hypothetical protein NPIL_119891 [Nephila pilipes]